MILQGAIMISENAGQMRDRLGIMPEKKASDRSMVYFTGDIHGYPWVVSKFCRKLKLTADDVIVLLGDVGANYYGDERDERVKAELSKLRPTILCIHGNHEIRPWRVNGYRLQLWKGGQAWVQEKYPNLLFAKDGEVFTIDGLRYIVIGGAYSVDKHYRLSRGNGWWEDEQPSEEIKAYVEAQLKRRAVDVVLSHTCPYRYEPTEVFLQGIDQDTVDDSTEKWLESLEINLNYKAWFCGHWHIDKRIDKMHFLFHSYESAENLLPDHDPLDA